jgi:hypothetical protein
MWTESRACGKKCLTSRLPAHDSLDGHTIHAKHNDVLLDHGQATTGKHEE